MQFKYSPVSTMLCYKVKEKLVSKVKEKLVGC